MRRRHFIQGACAALLIPGSALAGSPGGAFHDVDVFFYDERFSDARTMALECSGAVRLVPVTGDMTAVWNEYVRPACGLTTLNLAGVTTESFHFCLGRMVNAVTHMNSTISRIGRDLHLWHIQARNDQTRLTGI